MGGVPDERNLMSRKVSCGSWGVMAVVEGALVGRLWAAAAAAAVEMAAEKVQEGEEEQGVLVRCKQTET